MRKKLINLLFLWLLAIVSPAQILRRPVAAPCTGTGAYSLDHTDVFSFTINQAALAQLTTNAAGIYAERRFLLNQLNNYTLAAGILTSSGNIGFSANYFGFSDYNETRLGLAYGRKLGSKAAIGAQFNYHGISIAGYGNASAVSIEAGMIAHLSEKLHSGIHINNPVGGKFGKMQQEKLPAVYTLGIGYEASDKFFISTELIKEEDQPLNVNTGFQYKFLAQLFVRGGLSSATSSPWMGIGVSRGSLRIDITTSFHPQLGITPGLLLLFKFNQTKNEK